MGVLSSFHPAVRRWFMGRFPEGPSPPQVSGWPAIARRENTLIAAPTGSGKTLAAFLVCIDEFYRQALPLARFGCDEDEPFRLEPLPFESHSSSVPVRGVGEQGERPKGVEVLYISPLKALAVDIQENLTKPLAEIEGLARSMGMPVPEIRIGMRSGDTPASARAAMLKKPPQILVTTPESLYLLLTSARGREILRPVRTVIVDEIHAMARDKRGSHLASKRSATTRRRGSVFRRRSARSNWSRSSSLGLVRAVRMILGCRAARSSMRVTSARSISRRSCPGVTSKRFLPPSRWLKSSIELPNRFSFIIRPWSS